MEMVRLTTCHDAFEARVLAARLGAEGVLWSLRGGYDGPLAIGAVDVLVDVDDLEVARDLLADTVELEPVADPRPERAATRRDVLLLVAVVVGVVLFAIVRMGAAV